MARKLEVIRESKKGHLSQSAYLNKASHYWGGLAEIIVGNVLGIPPDMSAEIDGGHDFVLEDGRTVDVKGATFYTAPDLKLPVHTLPAKMADVYVLVSFNQDRLLARIVGWATKDELLCGKVKSYGKDQRYRENFTIAGDELHDMNDLTSSQSVQSYV